jgi:hypothetical protein
MSGTIDTLTQAATTAPDGPLHRLAHLSGQQAGPGNGRLAVAESLKSVVAGTLHNAGDTVSLSGATADANAVLSQTARQLGGAAPSLVTPTSASAAKQDLTTITTTLTSLTSAGQTVGALTAFDANAVAGAAARGVALDKAAVGLAVDQVS